MNPLFACVRAARPTPVVVELAREFSPRWQRQGPGCVVCDVSGLERLLGEPAAIGAELARAAAVYGPAVRVAIAPTMTASMLLTLAYAELTVATSDPAAVLASLPLVHLQQLVAEATGTTLLRPATRAGQDAARQRHERAFDMARRWGVTTIGAFAALDAGELSARMGQEGLRAAATRAGPRSRAAGAGSRRAALRRADGARMAARHAGAAVVRARAAARSAGGRAGACGSRRGGDPARSAARRSDDAQPGRCSCRWRCAIRACCARC